MNLEENLRKSRDDYLQKTIRKLYEIHKIFIENVRKSRKEYIQKIIENVENLMNFIENLRKSRDDYLQKTIRR